ncbi:MAG: heme A synthase [Pseudomonadota bacterium]
MSDKRSIFEEVAAPRKSVPASPPVSQDARPAIRVWLIVLFALVVIMVGVGGLTRLTDSGLSITEWRPVTGALPPLSEAAWMAEFEKYRAIPEYELQNAGMTLDAFKTIYWWEWGHRQLGRVIGLVWAAGFAGFVLTRRIPRGWTGRLLLPGVLGGVQGAIGWWMVSSGLEPGRVDVASTRLAVHLGLAFAILGLLAWLILRLSTTEAELLQARRRREGGLGAATGMLAALVFVQVLLGALVAGIDAGRSYTTWPLMGGQILPPTAFDLTPLWRNLVENPGLVQFVHRGVGYGVVLAVLAVWMLSRRSPVGQIRRALDYVALATVAQLLLGIWTVVASAPWPLGLAHQIIAVLLFALTLRARFYALYPPAERIARA